MMSTKDITERQLETLILMRFFEDFAKENPDYPTIKAVADGITMGEIQYTGTGYEYERFINDSFVLAKKGYIVSDMDEPDEIFDEIPQITEITQKGLEILAELEGETAEAVKAGNKIVLFENLNINLSLLGGIEFDINTPFRSGALIASIGKAILKRG